VALDLGRVEYVMSLACIGHRFGSFELLLLDRCGIDCSSLGDDRFLIFLQIEIFIRCSYYDSGGYSTGGTRVYVMVPCVMGGIMFLSKFSTASRIHSRTPSRRMKRKCYSNCLQLDCAPQFDFGLNTVFSRTAFQYQTLRASTFARNYASRVLGAMPILEKKRKPEFLCSYQNFNYKHYK
jgi:hypothetical protein